ncbi:MAG: MMPL family transporter, partial [Gaiellales bacterium]
MTTPAQRTPAHDGAPTRLGRLAGHVAGRRTKWFVILIWLVLVGLSVPAQGLLEERSTNSSASFLPEAAESTKVGELLRTKDVFADGENIPAIVVFQSGDGTSKLDADDQVAISTWLDGLKSAKELPSDALVIAPSSGGPMAEALRSKDGSTLLAVISLESPDVDQIKATIKLVRDRSNELEQSGIKVFASGPAGFVTDTGNAFSGIDGKLILGTSLLVLTLLLLIYRSPLIALVPLLAVGMAAALSRAVLGAAIDPFDLIVSGQTSGIMLILIFGAGTDYCLLIVARFREELHRNEDPHDAMRHTVQHTTPAILSSGVTVILAMLVLLFAE